MWHEARKQEKKLRGLMVDLKRRAERRREYYERIKKDPHSFLRMYGQPVKIHLDPAVAAAAESPQSMMPWQGDRENMIDRFDVRANLDIIPFYDGSSLPEAEEVEDGLRCNYERYRCVVQNDCAGVSEEQFLKQIYIDEMYGDISKNKEAEEEKKRLSDKKAAIAFKYEDSTPAKSEAAGKSQPSESESDDTDIEDVDLDVAFDIDEITEEQKQQLNLAALNYGVAMGEFTEQLRKDKDEELVLKEARAMEEEKAAFSGRKSRRERRIFKEQKIRDRQMSPPSYATRESPKYNPYQKSSEDESSRSPSPATTRVTFITSFGGVDAEQETPVVPPHQLSSTKQREEASGSRHSRWRQRSRSRGHSPHSSNRKRSYSPLPPSSSRRNHSPSSHVAAGRRTYSPSSPTSAGRRTYSPSSPTGAGRRHTTRPALLTVSSRTSYSYRRSSSRSSRSLSRSPSASRRSRGRSPQRSTSSSQSQKQLSAQLSKSPTPKIVKRYRRPSLESKSSDSEASSQEDTAASTRGTNKDTGLRSTAGNVLNKSATSSKNVPVLTAKEKLKRKMQAALNRHYKADKRTEQEKKEKAKQEKLDREDELRARLDDFRRKERERRLQDDGSSSGRQRSVSRSLSPSSRSRSRSWSPQRPKRARSPARSRSRSRDRRHRYM